MSARLFFVYRYRAEVALDWVMHATRWAAIRKARAKETETLGT
jgi:hypothetical protein